MPFFFSGLQLAFCQRPRLKKTRPHTLEDLVLLSQCFHFYSQGGRYIVCVYYECFHLIHLIHSAPVRSFWLEALHWKFTFRAFFVFCCCCCHCWPLGTVVWCGGCEAPVLPFAGGLLLAQSGGGVCTAKRSLHADKRVRDLDGALG